MTEQLKPCPFCGNTEPGFERIGTSRQSCIVACGDCGARHESSDEGEASGASWNRRAQPAQAVPVLTESELRSILQGTNHMVKNAMHGAFWPELEEACRAIEQAARAKMGAAVPMTHMQIVTLWGHRSDGPSTPEIVSFARLVERHHGIVGKEGA